LSSFCLTAESLVLPFFNQPNALPISVDFPAERISFLLGENGSGKSTLLKVLLGVQVPIAGRSSAGRLSATARAKILAWVDQSPSSNLAYSATEVVAMSDAPGEVVESSLRSMGIEHLRDKPMKHLSGGEQRRVHLARAFAQNTPWLLMDEPATNLDIANEIALMEHLGQLVEQKRSVLLSTHNLRHVCYLPKAQRGLVLIMKAGQVQFMGNASEESIWIPALAQSAGLSTEQLLTL
jgi:iron complex transport system ATP-binding protein